MVWVDYGGQDVTGYDYIGTDTLRYPLTDGRDVKETVEEIRRRCGRLARIKLFKEKSDEVDGDR
jgi:hypothetical protein